MKTSEKKSENLVQRLNRSMEAIEIVPGTMIKVRKISHGLEEKFATNTAFKTVFIDKYGSHAETSGVRENEYLLYLGIEKIGPFNWVGRDKRPNQRLLMAWNQEILAFKFLYAEEYVYLLINHPHDYYNVFIKNVQRIGGIVSFGK